MRLALKHFIYAPDVAKNFAAHFSPLIPTLEDGKQVLDFSRHGTLHTYVKSGAQFEMASLPEEAEAIESYFHWYTPKPGDTVFDIGAHCGVSTYHFSKLVGPSGRVVAFEPDPLNFPLLLRNIERHDLTNVTPVQIAIAGTRGKLAFNAEGATGSGLAHTLPRASVGDVVLVEAITLEDAFTNWGTPQLCKIDIEGSEIEVISAAAPHLSHRACEFVLDTSHIVDGAPTARHIEDLFRSCGYEASTSNFGLETTWAHPSV